MNHATLDHFLSQSPRDLAAAPVDLYQELLAESDRLQAYVRTVRLLVQQVGELRYGEQARAQLLAGGRDTGTTHVIDGDFDVTAEIDKTVIYDQDQLAELYRRIAATGEDPRQYMDVKYSVPEAKYLAWPDRLRQPFEAARTVKPGKPKFTLKRLGEEPR